MARFAPIRTGDADLDRVQDAIAKSLNATAEPAIYARAHQASAQAVPAATPTAVRFDAVECDSGQGIVLGPPWGYVAPAEGLYHVDAAVNVEGWGTGAGELLLKVDVNGAEQRRGARLAYAVGQSATVGMSADLHLAAGDRVSIVVYVSVAQTLAPLGSVGTWFNIHRVPGI